LYCTCQQRGPTKADSNQLTELLRSELREFRGTGWTEKTSSARCNRTVTKAIDKLLQAARIVQAHLPKFKRHRSDSVPYPIDLFEIELDRAIGPICNRQYRTKRKGDLSYEKPPFLSDFLKLWFGFQITTSSSRNPSVAANRSPRFPYSSAIPLVVRAFWFPSFTVQLPGGFASLVADSLDEPCLLSPAGRSLFR
jgi:hypothetical protein